ncbi:MAG: hypothetical protein QOE92_2462 [Chloroflexota bacterium]|nr:hypothetical protein [Chloroflexota bacterium]
MIVSALRRAMAQRGMRGQTVVIGAFALVVLVGVVGLAVDGAVAYGYSVSLERGAAAAALSGVSYLPAKPGPGGATPNATTRALDEAKRNGFDPADPSCRCTVSITTTNNGKDLVVTIGQTVPTFFMQALGVPPFPVSRTAEAGYRPPIRLGSPDNQFGSTVSQIGTAGNFYVLRTKAWSVSGYRAEGDAYTPDPTQDTSPGSTDVHAISRSQGSESQDSLITALPASDRGGQNFRIVVPSGAGGGELQVYNAGFGPNMVGNENSCENWLNFASTAGKCNGDPTQNLKENDGAHVQCTGDCSGQKSTYSAVMYTLFKVNDELLRSTDQVMVQTKIYPVDASNYNANPPTYLNVHTGQTITQTYLASGAPANMKTYHSWTNIANENGGSDPGMVSRAGVGVCSGSCGSLQPGTYRLRVDLLDADGNITQASFRSASRANHAYALRIVNPGTLPNAASTPNVCIGSGGVKCTVGGWEDAVMVSTLSSVSAVSDNYFPLFELPVEYAGSTVNIDLFDFGDVSVSNNVSIMDPTRTGFTLPDGSVAGIANATGLTITDRGNGRNTSPSVQHLCAGSGGAGQCPNGTAPAGTNDVPHIGGATLATYCTRGCSPTNQPYNGTWIRVSIPVPSTYNPGTDDFWWAQYHMQGTSVDTFSMAVSADGGPVHLISS